MSGPLLYLLIFATMSLSVASVTGDVTDTSDNLDETNNQGQWNAFQYCPDGWITYSSPNESSCLVLRKASTNFYDAKTYCESLGGALVHAATQHKYDFIRNLAKTEREYYQHYWIGLYKGPGPEAQFHWLSIYGVIGATKGSLPENIENGRNSFSETCTYISYSEYLMTPTSCSPGLYSICEKDMSICQPGTFGKGCGQTCHCKDEPCSLESFDGQEVMICRNGCQRNWTGLSCDIEKPVPEIQYYCINETETQKAYAYIQIFTNGVQYRDIYLVDSSAVRLHWCPSTIVNTSSSDLTTITIPINNVSIGQMSRGECAGQQLDEKTFTWHIVIKEKVDILLENDLKMTISCNFSVADSLLSSERYSIQREEFLLPEKTIEPVSAHDDVQLKVVRAYSGQSVTEAAIGSVVYLEMRYALNKGSHLTGVRPYNCVVFSPDRIHVIQLLTERGCAATHSPVEAFKRREDKIVTPWFYLFALEDSPSVTFQCSFHLCFTSECDVGCRQPTRDRRDTEHVRDEEPNSITRTVRVLPSIHAKQTTGGRQVEDYQQPAGPPAPPPGYNMGPAIYLNPVTCSLFLIILLVFLCMYIAFIRTLRKSVYDIRREIEVRRSRDKFLHCGCVQQKERDTVTTRA